MASAKEDMASGQFGVIAKKVRARLDYMEAMQLVELHKQSAN